MRKSQIVLGVNYSNGKGRIRKVIGIGNYPLYTGQSDHDDVKYEVISDGAKQNVTGGRIGVMTRASFAVWAKEIVKDAM